MGSAVVNGGCFLTGSSLYWSVSPDSEAQRVTVLVPRHPSDVGVLSVELASFSRCLIA